MHLDVYRSCSRREKREVLGVFWHRGVDASPRIREAALQYGPWAVVSLVVVALELVAVLAFSVSHLPVVAWFAAIAAFLAVLSAGWAALRLSELRGALAA